MTIEAITSSIRASLYKLFTVTTVKGGTRVTLPYVLHDDSVFSVRIEHDGDSAFITDDGMVLHHLEMSGVDFDDKKIWATWEHLREKAASGAGDSLTPGSSSGEWELAATASVERLGDAVLALATTAMQADGLVHFSGATRTTKESFKDIAARELRSALDEEYLLLSKESLPSRVEGYALEPWLTMRKGASGAEIYLEAVGGGDLRRKVEHAVTNFSISTTGKERHATVIDQLMDQNSSHARILSTVSRLATPIDPTPLIGQVERIESQLVA